MFSHQPQKDILCPTLPPTIEYTKHIQSKGTIMTKITKQDIIKAFQSIQLDLAEKGFTPIDQPARSKKNVYEWKNSNKKRALEITRNYFLEFHIEFLFQVVSNITKPPKRILDIGCDDGTTTYVLACLFPAAEVIGIDKFSTSIQMAKKLTKGFENTPSFIKIDITENNLVSLGKFDIITAKNVFYELFDIQSTPEFWRTSELTDSLRSFSNKPKQELANISDILVENGLFFSTERICNSYTLGKWGHLLHQVGLNVDISSSFTINAELNGENDRLPFLICKKGEPSSFTIENALMLGHLWEFQKKINQPFLEFQKTLIKKLINGDELLHAEVHIALLDLKDNEPKIGWLIERSYSDISLKEIITSKYGDLVLDLRESLKGAQLSLLKIPLKDFIDETEEEFQDTSELTRYETLEAFSQIDRE